MWADLQDSLRNGTWVALPGYTESHVRVFSIVHWFRRNCWRVEGYTPEGEFVALRVGKTKVLEVLS